MGIKKLIGVLLVFSLLISGCNTKAPEIETTDEFESIEIVDTTETSETATEPAVQLVPFEFNPHVYTAKVAERIPQDHWDALYNLCDALRAGENTFECASQEAYDWSTDISTLCDLFPAAGYKIEAHSDDGSPAFENGIGKISYKMPVEDFLIREQEFEDLIEDIINSNVESDDTEYERALKLYLYVAKNFTYDENNEVTDDNFVYSTFMSKRGVCVNFASVYAYLLLQVGIDAVSVGIFETDMCHSWTYAVINGKGYHIDTTWALSTCYGMDSVYLDYFLMSDDDRIEDGCLVRDLTIQLFPEFWLNRTSVEMKATDDTYNVRYYCYFVSLDEENKILHYKDMYDEMHELHYDI